MGGTSYSTEARETRAVTRGYATKDRDEIFEQRSIHETMNPVGVMLRECRDSEAHPEAVPIILGLDVTSSMGIFPHELIKGGLPKLMSGLIRTGLTHASLCFAAVTDHLSGNRAPLQIGQFESGDAELDMWLERTWLEGGGGGQNHESYMLVWLFALHVVQTDAWEKRGKKGFIITIGDERNHPDVTHRRLVEVFGREMADRMCPNGDRITSQEILRAARERWHVYHITYDHGNYGNHGFWQGQLGDCALRITDHVVVPEVIAQTILDHPETDATYDPSLFHSDEHVGGAPMEV